MPLARGSSGGRPQTPGTLASHSGSSLSTHGMRLTTFPCIQGGPSPPAGLGRMEVWPESKTDPLHQTPEPASSRQRGLCAG